MARSPRGEADAAALSWARCAYVRCLAWPRDVSSWLLCCRLVCCCAVAIALCYRASFLPSSKLSRTSPPASSSSVPTGGPGLGRVAFYGASLVSMPPGAAAGFGLRRRPRSTAQLDSG